MSGPMYTKSKGAHYSNARTRSSDDSDGREGCHCFHDVERGRDMSAKGGPISIVWPH